MQNHELTCGAAKELPDKYVVAFGSPMVGTLILSPGAKKETRGPQFDFSQRASAIVIAPTVLLDVTLAGEYSATSRY